MVITEAKKMDKSGSTIQTSWFKELFPTTWVHLETVQVCEHEVTKSQADIVLAERNNRNRKPLKHQTDILASALRNNEWMLNGDTLVFDWDGECINGQNRLRACSKTGIPFKTLIVVGVDPNAFKTLDQQSRRTLAQMLEVEGQANSAKLSAGLSLLMRLTMYGHLNTGGLSGITIGEKLAFFEKHPEITYSVTWCNRRSLANTIKSPGLIVLCHYLFSQYKSDLADRFFQVLTDRFVDKEGFAYPEEPGWGGVRVLAKKFMDNAMSNAKHTLNTLGAFWIKTWNALCEGKDIGNLKFLEGEQFPMPVGWKRTKDGDLVLDD